MCDNMASSKRIKSIFDVDQVEINILYIALSTDLLQAIEPNICDPKAIFFSFSSTTFSDI